MVASRLKRSRVFLMFIRLSFIILAERNADCFCFIIVNQSFLFHTTNAEVNLFSVLVYTSLEIFLACAQRVALYCNPNITFSTIPNILTNYRFKSNETLS